MVTSRSTAGLVRRRLRRAQAQVSGMERNPTLTAVTPMVDITTSTAVITTTDTMTITAAMITITTITITTIMTMEQAQRASACPA